MQINLCCLRSLLIDDVLPLLNLFICYKFYFSPACIVNLLGIYWERSQVPLWMCILNNCRERSSSFGLNQTMGKKHSYRIRVKAKPICSRKGWRGCKYIQVIHKNVQRNSLGGDVKDSRLFFLNKIISITRDRLTKLICISF